MSLVVMRDWHVTKWQGLVPYQQAWDAMKAWTDSRDAKSIDALWIMQHPPVYTQGLAGRSEHILNPKQIPVVQTDRGGQVTYHGPGQLMLYSLFDIERMGFSTRDFVRRLEQVVVSLLATFGIEAAGRVDSPGVYVAEKKICSIGLRVKKGRSYHGCALNVSGDLEPFQGINPCGFNELEMACITDYTLASWETVINEICHQFAWQFDFVKPKLQVKEQWEAYEPK